jgi:hypothetical protein
MFVFIDQKDAPLFWKCFDSANHAGTDFRYFSVVPGQRSFIYNPFRNP